MVSTDGHLDKKKVKHFVIQLNPIYNVGHE